LDRIGDIIEQYKLDELIFVKSTTWMKMNNNHNIDELDNIDEKYHVDEIMWLAESWSNTANLFSHDRKVECVGFFFTRYDLPKIL